MCVRGLDELASALAYAIATNHAIRERISREKKAIQDEKNETSNAAESCAVKDMYVWTHTNGNDFGKRRRDWDTTRLMNENENVLTVVMISRAVYMCVCVCVCAARLGIWKHNVHYTRLESRHFRLKRLACEAKLVGRMRHCERQPRNSCIPCSMTSRRQTRAAITMRESRRCVKMRR